MEIDGYEIRGRVITKFPRYMIVYRIVEDYLDVLTVRHSSQKMDDLVDLV
jgi:hypothetical protein